MGVETSFSTEGIPDAQRSDRFREHMHRWFAVRLDLTPARDAPLQVQMRGYRGDRLRFASFSFSPHVTRFEGVARTSPRLLVSLVQRGSAEVWQHGQSGRVEAGQTLIVDTSQPFIIDSDAIETTSLYVEAAALRASAPHLRLMTAIPLDDRAICGLFRNVAGEIVQIAPSLEHAEADGLSDMVAVALGSAMRAHESERPIPIEPAPTQRLRVQAFARASLHDPTLSVEAVARRFDLSTRRIHQLFEDDGTSFMRWVWQERLARCRDWLSDPARRGLSVSEVAFAWGFSDAGHFSRSFRRAFGCTPSEMRKLAHGDAERA